MDILATVSSSISITRRLIEISKNIAEAEFRNLLADLSVELAEAKVKIADLITENSELKQKVASFSSVDGEICPKCHQRGWVIEKSENDRIFGELGAVRRYYKCKLCNFSEEKVIT